MAGATRTMILKGIYHGKGRLSNRLESTLGIVVILALWEITARAMGNPVFPPFTVVSRAFCGLLFTGAGVSHILASLEHIVTGFALAAVVGITLGTGIAQNRMIALLLTPVVDAMRPIAALTLFPLLILVLGLGLWSKVFVIFWTSWPAVLLNTVQGLVKVNTEVVSAAHVDGASEWLCLWHIKFPLALPTIMTGLRIGLSGGWISLVSAEMLGASSGLGYAVLAYSQTFHFAEMYAVILMIAILGLLMNFGLAKLQSAMDYDMEGAIK